MRIFAYGSNMNIERLQRRVPSATKISNAFVTGYVLKCNKVSTDGSSKANIVQSDNQDDIVWGILFEIADNEKGELDSAEGLGHGYNETSLDFTSATNTIHRAQVYIADYGSVNNNLQPYDWYRQFMLTGARQNELPQDYIDKIDAMEFTIDQNKERRQRNLNISMDIFNLIAKSSLHLIMVRPRDTEPMGFGSGCIVSYKGRFFLLSVAHVTDIDGLSTCIETNQPPVDLHTPIYSVSAMCYFDEYKLPNGKKQEEIKTFEELLVSFDETLEITFCEIKEHINLLQPEWDFGAFKINSGAKVSLNLELAGQPEKGKLFGFCGRVRQDLVGIKLKSQPTLKLGLQYQGTTGRFHYFLSPELIRDVDDYSGCSGSPILDEDGKLVALTASVMRNTKLIFGFSIDECKKLLDLAIETKLV